MSYDAQAERIFLSSQKSQFYCVFLLTAFLVSFSTPLSNRDAATGSQEALIYFLFEHKSQSDAFTAFQLLSYLVRIWEKRLRDGFELCPIIPLVVYHGQTGWTAAQSLRELLGNPQELAEYQVDFRFPLPDLSR